MKELAIRRLAAELQAAAIMRREAYVSFIASRSSPAMAAVTQASLRTRAAAAVILTGND